MSIKSPDPTSVTSSTTPPHRNGLFELSPYALAGSPSGALGAHGGILMKPIRLRQGDWRVGENLAPGTFVPAEVVAAWPLPNRLALSSSGFIRYFQTPAEAEAMGAEIAARAAVDPGAEAARRRRADQLAVARSVKAAKHAAENQQAAAAA